MTLPGTIAGWYYFRNRFYDATHARFLTRDPIGNWGDPSQMGNAYGFALADAVNGMDPHGLDPTNDHHIWPQEWRPLWDRLFGEDWCDWFTIEMPRKPDHGVLHGYWDNKKAIEGADGVERSWNDHWRWYMEQDEWINADDPKKRELALEFGERLAKEYDLDLSCVKGWRGAKSHIANKPSGPKLAGIYKKILGTSRVPRALVRFMAGFLAVVGPLVDIAFAAEDIGTLKDAVRADPGYRDFIGAIDDGNIDLARQKAEMLLGPGDAKGGPDDIYNQGRLFDVVLKGANERGVSSRYWVPFLIWIRAMVYYKLDQAEAAEHKARVEARRAVQKRAEEAAAGRE